MTVFFYHRPMYEALEGNFLQLIEKFRKRKRKKINLTLFLKKLPMVFAFLVIQES